MLRLAFLLFPLAEIAGFVIVGREIGVLATLGLVLLGVVIGALLLRSAGFDALGAARREMDAGRDPGPRLVRAFLTALAGVLFIVPGFVSDALAVVLLLPPVHRRAWNFLRDRVRVFRGGAKPPAPARVIELERTDYVARPDPASPWAGGPKKGA